MARLVKRTATAPHKLDPGSETRWICACGLSKHQPFCDGSHRALGTANEEGALYWYDDEGKRHEAADAMPNMRGW